MTVFFRKVFQWLRLYSPKRTAVCLAAALLCAACTASQPIQIINYALDGPPLALVARVDDYTFEGTLERKGMVGIGELALKSLDRPDLVCKGELHAEPGYKGRVRSAVPCSDGSMMLFSLRNLGPDQGLGIGTFGLPGSEEFGQIDDELRHKALRADSGAVRAPLGGLLVMFYHPSAEEARRRIVPIQKDMQTAMSMARSQGKSLPVWSDHATMVEPRWSAEELENARWHDAGAPTP